jgi:two-component system sensor histidine kinase UhpB
MKKRTNTARQRVDRNLDNSTQRSFKRLAENAQDMFYRYRIVAPRRTEYVSPAVLAITGHRPEEFYTDPDLMLKAVHPEDRHHITEVFQADPARLKRLVVLRWVRPDGRVAWVEHRRVPILDRKGQMIALEGVGRDVTERIEAERRLAEGEQRLRESESQMRKLAASLQKAREQEREEVARELHDELGQTLTGLKLELTRTFRELLTRGVATDMIDRVQSMVGAIELATETVRRLATSLRPPALDHLGLAAAIELEAASVSRRTGVRCRIAGTRQLTRLNPEQTTAVFRIVQEALTNVIRHANASAVRIALRQSPRSTSVTIHDNGCGITGDAVRDRGSIGLLGMRERAELIGATLTIMSEPGKGTSIVVTVPSRPRSHAADR